MWDPAVTYTTQALDAKAALPTVGEKPSHSGTSKVPFTRSEAFTGR